MDLDACLNDSPLFRNQLTQNESSLDELEAKMERVLKMSAAVNEAGKVFVSQQTQFLASLWEMRFATAARSRSFVMNASFLNIVLLSSSHFSNDDNSNLNRIIQTIQEVVKLQNGVFDSSHKAVSKALSRFLKEDVKQMKDTKGYFNKISADLDSALQVVTHHPIPRYVLSQNGFPLLRPMHSVLLSSPSSSLKPLCCHVFSVCTVAASLYTVSSRPYHHDDLT